MQKGTKFMIKWMKMYLFWGQMVHKTDVYKRDNINHVMAHFLSLFN